MMREKVSPAWCAYKKHVTRTRKIRGQNVAPSWYAQNRHVIRMMEIKNKRGNVPQAPA